MASEGCGSHEDQVGCNSKEGVAIRARPESSVFLPHPRRAVCQLWALAEDWGLTKANEHLWGKEKQANSPSRTELDRGSPPGQEVQAGFP